MIIGIGRRNFLLYKLLAHEMKTRLMPPDSSARLDGINDRFNEQKHSGERATGYDQLHGYDADHHEETARWLITRRWARDGYGEALEIGAGSGHFSTLIARRAQSVIAVEPVADLRAVIEERCRREGASHVRAVGATAFDLRADVADASVDSALIVHSLHHMHRRQDGSRSATCGRSEGRRSRATSCTGRPTTSSRRASFVACGRATASATYV